MMLMIAPPRPSCASPAALTRFSAVAIAGAVALLAGLTLPGQETQLRTGQLSSGQLSSGQQGPGKSSAFVQPAPNPYKLEPFEPAYPVELDYPPMAALEFDHGRRQILRQLANNLQGNVRKEAWQLAVEFFWRAPEDSVEPLVEAMDRAMTQPALSDVVRNCVEAMGKTRMLEFDSALRRALQHRTEAVRQAAYSSLAACGSAETLKQLYADFVHMNGRARQRWLQAVAERLPADRVVLLRTVLMAEFPPAVHNQALLEILKLPPKEVAQIVRGRWATASGDLKGIIAGVLHATGDGAGTAWLQDALTGEDLYLKKLAIQHVTFGNDDDATIGALREPLLLATTHPRGEIRLAAAQRIARLSGDDVADVFEVLTAPDEAWEIRSLALRELIRRGRDQIVSVLLEELPTATGTRLQSIINQLSASGDPRAVPVLLERFRATGPGQGRHFLQALAHNGSDAAAEALCTIFAGPEKVVSRRGDNPLTTRSYLPLLLLNLRGTERVVIDRFLKLGKDQWRQRALLMPTVVGYAVDRRDNEELRAICIDPVRAILFNSKELPQLRVQALNLLARNWLTIDDLVRIKRMRRKEQPGMRALFNSFLADAY